MLFVASDHAGVRVKKFVCDFALKKNIICEDLSVHNRPDDDYPDFAKLVAFKIKNKNKGVLICGSGIGMSISANKIKGVRAALCGSVKDAELSRKHNDANILVLSSKLSKVLVHKMIDVFLATKFEGGRHLRRVKKIKKLENLGGCGGC